MAGNSAFEKLPVEIMRLIMANVPLQTRDLINLATTSKTVHAVFLDPRLPIEAAKAQYRPYVLLKHPSTVVEHVDGQSPMHLSWVQAVAIADHYEEDWAPLLERYTNRDTAMVAAALQDTMAAIYTTMPARRILRHQDIHAFFLDETRIKRLNLATLLRSVLQPEAALLLRWIADIIKLPRTASAYRKRHYEPALEYILRREIRRFSRHWGVEPLAITLHPIPGHPNCDLQLAFVLDQYVQSYREFKQDIPSILTSETSKLHRKRTARGRVIEVGEARFATERTTTKRMMKRVEKWLADKDWSSKLIDRIKYEGLAEKITSVLARNNSLNDWQLEARTSYEARQLGLAWNGFRERNYADAKCLPKFKRRSKDTWLTQQEQERSDANQLYF